MSKSWTPLQRYNDTKQYLAQIDAALAAHVHQNLPVSVQAAGLALSLSGNMRYAAFGSSSTGRAGSRNL